jgi:hypothetical protein
MKRTTILLASALLVGTCAVQVLAKSAAKPASAKSDAETAAEAWLKLTDASSYGQTWQTASPLFQSAVTQEQWAQAAASVRGPLGKVKSRTLKKITYAHRLPGAPDGTYAVIQYHTVFEHKSSAVETITPMKEKNGQWRVSGYFIK